MAETELLAPPAPTVAPIADAPGGARPRVRFSPSLGFGLLFLLGPLIASLIGRLLVGRHGTDIFAYDPSASPSGDRLLGTDGSGRDVLAVMIYSTAPTFELVLLAGLVGTFVGTAAGLVSGYLRGLPDTAVRGVSDVMLGIPPFAMLILIAAVLGRLTLVTMALVIAAFSWPLAARAVRSQVLTLREQPFVVVSRLSNRSAPALMAFELLPNMLTLVMGTLVGAVSGALAIAIGLQLIGLGPIDTQTLGLALQNALSAGALSQGLWWWWLPPTLILIMFFVGLFLISMAVDEVANPRLRGAGERA
jgi:peptide/nickel transport system permease protein